VYEGAVQDLIDELGRLPGIGPKSAQRIAFHLLAAEPADVGRLAAAVGIDMKDAFSLFEHFNPGQTLPQRAKRISSGQYTPPSFEMSMARKDLRLIVETGRARHADAGDGAGAGEAVG